MTFAHENEMQKTVHVDARYVWFDKKEEVEQFLHSEGNFPNRMSQQAISYDLHIVGGPCHNGKYLGYHAYEYTFEKELQKARQDNPAFVMKDIDMDRLNSAAVHCILRAQLKKNLEIHIEKDKQVEIQQGIQENGRQIVVRPYAGDKLETEILKLMMFNNAKIPAKRINDEWLFMHACEGIGLKVTME